MLRHPAPGRPCEHAAMTEVQTSSQRVTAIVVRGPSREERPDSVAGEEPLQIRACGPGQMPQDVAVTMRTPGSERELAVGFLIAEGLLDPADAPRAAFEHRRSSDPRPAPRRHPRTDRTADRSRRDRSAALRGHGQLRHLRPRLHRRARGADRSAAGRSIGRPVGPPDHAGHDAFRPGGLRDDRRTPRRGALHAERRAHRAARGHRPSQRRRQARRRPGPGRGPARPTTRSCSCRAACRSRSSRRPPSQECRSLCAVSAPSDLAIATAERLRHDPRRLPARRRLQRLRGA